MALEDTPPIISYAGNESISTAYPLPFVFFDDAHVKLYIDGILSADGFAISGDGSAGTGEAVASVAYTPTQVVTFVRRVPYDQPVTLPGSGRVAPDTLERSYDYVSMQAQQVASDLLATPKALPGDAPPGGSFKQAANTTQGQDSDGNLIARTAAQEVAFLGIEAQVAAAENSATEASSSAIDAQTFANQSEDAAQNADASAVSAAASAVTASDGATAVEAALEASRQAQPATNILTFSDVADVGPVSVTVNGSVMYLSDTADISPFTAATQIASTINLNPATYLCTAEVINTRQVKIYAIATGVAGNGITCAEASSYSVWATATTEGGEDGKVLVSGAQTFDAGEKAQILTNIGAASVAIEPAPFYLYALGQSNMSRVNYGVPDYDTESIPGVLIWNDRPGNIEWQQWDVTAASSQSLSTASTTPSTTPAFHLAKKIHEVTGREVRVIISAQGGVSLPTLSDGGSLFTRLTDNIAAAGVTEADLVVLIQGEADDSGSDATHNSRLQTWLDDIRGLASVSELTPVILTEVNKQYTNANRRMKAFAEANSFVRYATGSKHLEMNGDGIHFTNNSCVAIGRGVIYDALQQPSVTPTGGATESRATVTTGEQYVTIPSGVYSNMTGSFTARMRWRPDFVLRTEQINHGGSGYLVCDFGRTTATNGAFGIMLTASAQLYIWVNDYTDRLTITLTTAQLDTGNTLDLGVTWDSATGLLTCYIDGVSVGSKTTVATGTQTVATLARLLGDSIGSKHSESVCKWAAFWSSVLASGTMTTISDDIPDLTGALAGYKLNTPPNDRLYDHSGNARHGTWVGTGAYSRNIV